MEYNNYALEWYNRGLVEKDPIGKFMFYWIAFSWLFNEDRYGEYGPREDRISETEAIRNYCKRNFETLNNYKAFNTLAINIFLQQAVKEMAGENIVSNGRSRYNSVLDDRRGAERERLISLMLSIYRVRCNLFHGSKKLGTDRDIELISASAKILEGYLHTVLPDSRL